MSSLLFFAVVGLLYVVAFRRPGAACGYTIAGFSLEQFAQAFVPIAGKNDSLCNYLIAGAVLVGLARTLMRDGLSSQPLRPPTLLMLTLLGFCYASTLWSLFPSVSRQILNAQLPYLTIYVALAPLLVARTTDLRDCVVSLIVCAGVSLAGLVLFAEWGTRGVMLLHHRGESNPLATTQAAGALLIAFAVSPTLKKLPKSARALVGISLLLAVTIAFLRTGSRGQIVAAISTTLLFSATRRGGSWAPIALLAMGGLVFGGFLSEEVARNAQRWDPDQVTRDISSGRVGEAEELLNFWSHSSLEHIILGLGHATAQDPRLLGAYPHVVPAEVLAEEGLVGITIYALTLGVGAYFYFSSVRRATGENRDYLRALSAITLYEFLLTLKQGTLLGQPSFLLLLVLSGAAAAGAREDPANDEQEEEEADPELDDSVSPA